MFRIVFIALTSNAYATTIFTYRINVVIFPSFLVIFPYTMPLLKNPLFISYFALNDNSK